MSSLTHFDDQGRAHMVDVGGKAATHRVAIATGRIEIDGVPFKARDGAALVGGNTYAIRALDDAEIVLVDSE